MNIFQRIYRYITGLFHKKIIVPKAGSIAKIGDPRTLQLQQLLNPQNLPPLPSEFIIESDTSFYPMFRNNINNNCVIAARGHATIRYELFEQGVKIPIQDYEIMNEYYKQTGGADNGLYIVPSLNAWRNGWIAGGKQYNIYAYAQVNHRDHTQVCYAIMKLKGLYVATNLTQSNVDQWYAGNPWTYWARDPVTFNHCIYVIGFDSIGPICATWNKIQHMTWEYWDNMLTECYAVIDNINSWMENSPLNVEELQKQLDAIKAIPSDSVTSVKVTVFDKYMNPVENCQIGVYIGDTPQTYAYTLIRNPTAPIWAKIDYGFGLFNGLRLGQEYTFTAQFQMANKQALYPVSVIKTLSASDPTTTNFTITLPFNYLASKEQGTLIL